MIDCVCGHPSSTHTRACGQEPDGRACTVVGCDCFRRPRPEMPVSGGKYANRRFTASGIVHSKLGEN